MSGFIKKAFYVLAALVLAFIIGWFIFLNIPKASSEGKTADVQISVDELYTAFESDEAAANDQYIGKIVEVTGTITEITADEQGAPVVLLASGSGMGGVLVTLEKDQKEKIDQQEVGGPITLKGVCTGMLMEVVLNKGVVVE